VIMKQRRRQRHVGTGDRRPRQARRLHSVLMQYSAYIRQPALIKSVNWKPDVLPESPWKSAGGAACHRSSPRNPGRHLKGLHRYAKAIPQVNTRRSGKAPVPHLGGVLLNNAAGLISPRAYKARDRRRLISWQPGELMVVPAALGLGSHPQRQCQSAGAGQRPASSGLSHIPTTRKRASGLQARRLVRAVRAAGHAATHHRRLNAAMRRSRMTSPGSAPNSSHRPED